MRRTGAAVGSVFSGEADSSRSRTPADQEQVTEPKLTEVPCPSSGRIGRSAVGRKLGSQSARLSYPPLGHRPAHWSQSRIGTLRPAPDRRNGVTFTLTDVSTLTGPSLPCCLLFLHRQLGCLAAVVALHARDLGMQPRFELKEIQVTPTAPRAVMDQLVLDATRRTRSTTTGVLELEIDPPLARVEFDIGDMPRRLQAKRGIVKRISIWLFIAVHRARGRRQYQAVVPPMVMFVEKSISTGNGIEPKSDAHHRDWLIAPALHAMCRSFCRGKSRPRKRQI